MSPRRPRFAVAAVLVTALALGVPGAIEAGIRALGPLRLPGPEATSVVTLDRGGRLLRAFTTADGRWRLPAETVDPRYVALLVATEDKRFYRHDGVDPYALARAAVQVVRSGHIVSGGSTLTMQVARLLEPRDGRTLRAKLRQVLRAIDLERRYDKAAILALYEVIAPFGGNIEGVRAASLAYFGHEPRRLSEAEAALLVALPQAPEARRPDRFPDVARAARDRVLARAQAGGLLSAAVVAFAERDGVARERRPFPSLAPHAAEAAVAAEPARGIHLLTLDARAQKSLETLAHDGAQRLGPRLDVAILAVDNATGAVRAHVGAADHLSVERGGAIDMAVASRSPGSALKPFIYAMAFEAGIAHPETILEDRPSRYGAYAPENFNLAYEGEVTARRALQASLNVPAIALLSQVGPDPFLARLRNAGAHVALPGDAPAGLAVGLGGLGIRLVDLARLYAGLARGGEPPPLRERRDGGRESLEADGPARPLSDPVSAWYVADVLRGAPPPQNAPAGRLAYKTGTSYGYRDAVAVGFDRDLTVAVWVGRPDNAAVPGLVGRQVAAPILFEAFARLGATYEPVPPPPGSLLTAAAALPPPLRRLRHDQPRGFADPAPRIAYPPDGARIDLDLAHAPAASLALKAQGGTPPLTWLVNGTPAASGGRREVTWRPDGAGFARVSVVDAAGRTDSVLVRLQ